MEERKRTLLAVVISCIIVASVGYSFTMSFFADVPDIVVADPSASPGLSVSPAPTGGQAGLPVEVTPETVQSVIAELSRFRSYSRTLTIRYAWSGGSGSVTAHVSVDGGWSRCDAELPGGLVERSITGDGTLWYWYGDGQDYLQADADLHSEDLVQHIPTYEDILKLDKSRITDAGYEEKDGVPAIYTQARDDGTGYLERYWVSVDSGLLVASETEKNGKVVYSMTASDMTSPLAEAGDAFTLPDGTVLHQIEG